MKRENLIKIWLVVIAVVLFSFSDWSFAAEDSEELLKTVWELLYLLVSVLSWIWVFFAKWAGEFLTNKWVYWEIIWLDVVLWQYRNVVKNMANFGLWFYFIYVIWKWVLNMSGIDKIKDKLVWLLVAGVWIQASWFMTAVVIDVSTVTLSAAWAFPSMIISNSSEVKDSFDTTRGDFLESGKALGNEITIGKKFSLFLSDMWKADFISITPVKLDENIKKEEFYDTIMPSAESVSGPLYYLWFSILRTPTLVSPKANSEQGWKTTIFNILLQWWTTIIFSIEMFVLLVFSVMRVFYMWVFIPMSPIVILLRCIKQASGKWENLSFVDSLTKQFNFTSFFWNAFKPTLIVLWFSLSMIFVSLISSIILSNGQDFDMGWLQTQNRRDGWDTGNGKWNFEYTTTIDGENAGILIKSGWKTLFEFILCIITIILVYRIIKFAVKMWWWNDFVTKKIGKFQDNITEDLGSLPLMPVAWWDEKTWERKMRYLSAGKVFWFWSSSNTNLLESKVWYYQNKTQDEYNKQNAIFDSWFGNESWYLSVDQVNAIETAMTTGNQVWDRLGKAKVEIDKMKQEDKEWTWFGMTLSRDTAKNDGFWINQFGNRLTAMKGKPVTGTRYNDVWDKMIRDWNSSQITDIEKKLEEIFKGHEDRIKAYADFFGLWNITTWEELKKADISKK